MNKISLLLINHGEILISEYVGKIKEPKFWAGDAKISETFIYYDSNIVIYKSNDYINDTDIKLSFYNIYRNLNLSNKNLFL